MALKGKNLSAPLKAKLLRHIRRLIKKGLIPLPADLTKSLVAGFSADIQILHRKQLRSLSFGAPEGVRVLLMHEHLVVAQVDFLYAGSRLQFLAAHSGHYIQDLVAAINALEKRYRLMPQRQTLQLVHFLWFPHPCLMVKEKGRRTFFHFPKGRLREISPQHLQKLVLQTQSSKSESITE